jgi:hypothetical protein
MNFTLFELGESCIVNSALDNSMAGRLHCFVVAELKELEPPMIGQRSNLELLQMLAEGRSNKDIATFLNVSQPETKKRLQTLFNELLEAKAGLIPGIATSPEPKPKALLYGLPCQNCHAYYSAEMLVCPICDSPDRVSPNAALTPPLIAVRTTEPADASRIN